MSNTIWISGSRGYVGSYLTSYLRDSGYEVRGLSNLASNDGAIISADFSDRSQIKKVLRKYGAPETFIHLGWKNVYEVNDECHIGSNVTNSINLIDEFYAFGTKRIMLVGTVSEYGGKEGLLRECDKDGEPENNYVSGKLAVGKYGLKAATQLNRIFIHIRLFNTYGSGQSNNSLINQLFACSLTNEQMKLSPCSQFRDYIHVTEAIEGIKRLSSVTESGIVNLGTGSFIQLKEFVKLFWKELGSDPSRLIFGAHEIPSYEQNQPKQFSDQSKIERLTGWSPKLSIEEGVKLTVNQWKNNIDSNF